MITDIRAIIAVWMFVSAWGYCAVVTTYMMLLFILWLYAISGKEVESEHGTKEVAG